MLALSGIFKFSAKSITLLRGVIFRTFPDVISALRTNVIYPQFTRPCYGARMLFNKESRVGIRSIIATATTRMRVQLNTVFTTEPLPDE